MLMDWNLNMLMDWNSYMPMDWNSYMGIGWYLYMGMDWSGNVGNYKFGVRFRNSTKSFQKIDQNDKFGVRFRNSTKSFQKIDFLGEKYTKSVEMGEKWVQGGRRQRQTRHATKIPSSPGPMSNAPRDEITREGLPHSDERN